MMWDCEPENGTFTRLSILLRFFLQIFLLFFINTYIGSPDVKVDVFFTDMITEMPVFLGCKF